MNKLNLFAYPIITVLSLASAFAAHAESPTVDTTAAQVWTQTKSRAQVQSELFQARADGSTKVYSISYNPLTAARTTLTREEVLAQARVDRDTDGAGRLYGEDSGSFHLAQTGYKVDASRTLAAR